jgi:hypothetical protein
MKAHTRKRDKDEALLISVAESIGSTLGALAAKANAAQKVLTRSRVAHAVEREGKKLIRKSKTVARKTRTTAAATLKRSKLRKATRSGLRRATSTAKQAARRDRVKARAARRARARR